MITANAPIRRILVPLDFSEQSQRAIPYAERMAGDHAELHLLHVNQAILAYAQAGAKVPPKPSQMGPSPEQLKSKLGEVPVGGGIESQKVKKVVIDGTPASAILDYANNNAIDLIVMTTHGQTGLMRLMMGSVAEQVVRKADCPVLTLKTGGSSGSSVR